MKTLTHNEIRNLWFKYFEKNGHKIYESAPLVPINDDSILWINAGVTPLKKYFDGTEIPDSRRIVNIQKCIRTNDIDNIGDSYHHTFFEMLGNWSLGDYFKKEAITWSYEFLTEVLKLPKEKLAVTIFAGNETLPYDQEAHDLWISVGIPEERILATSDDNFWIAGTTGPCGTDTEMFYWSSKDEVPVSFDNTDERWVEIWNDVFMQYEKHEDGSITELPQKNVDTGMGVERAVTAIEGVADNYKSSILKDIIKLIEDISNLPYEGNEKSMRIITDHLRTSVFISADKAGIKPSNTDQGYVLRRLIRRAIRHAKKLNIDINSNWEEQIANKIMDKYENYYEEIKTNRSVVLEVLKNEKDKFNRSLEKGLKEFEKAISGTTVIDGTTAFHLFDTYGFPLELTVELATERNIKVDEEGFKEKFKEHQEKSRAGATAKFKGGLASTGEIETKYHTATHLLNAALKEVVNKDIHQRGSNITEERMRFDFNCDHKLSDEEKQKTEDLVNKWIGESLDVTVSEMSKDEAIASGAECMFIEKYPDIVTVYKIGDISKELCGGPHVKNTSELGKFKIVKEEASSSGVRRIKAILE